MSSFGFVWHCLRSTSFSFVVSASFLVFVGIGALVLHCMMLFTWRGHVLCCYRIFYDYNAYRVSFCSIVYQSSWTCLVVLAYGNYIILYFSCVFFGYWINIFLVIILALVLYIGIILWRVVGVLWILLVTYAVLMP